MQKVLSIFYIIINYIQPNILLKPAIILTLVCEN